MGIRVLAVGAQVDVEVVPGTGSEVASETLRVKAGSDLHVAVWVDLLVEVVLVEQRLERGKRVSGVARGCR